MDRAFEWANSESRPTPKDLHALYTENAEDILESSQPPSSSSQPTTTRPQRSHHQASLLHSRLGGTGMLAPAFNPTRHSIMISGRPVQARPCHELTALQCHHHVNHIGISFSFLFQTELTARNVFTMSRVYSVQKHISQPVSTFLDQALVLTYESAPEATWEPYVAHRLWPLRPMICYGRDKSAQPPCKTEHAVFYFWQDCCYEITTIILESSQPPSQFFHSKRFRIQSQTWGTHVRLISQPASCRAKGVFGHCDCSLEHVLRRNFTIWCIHFRPRDTNIFCMFSVLCVRLGVEGKGPQPLTNLTGGI